MADLGSLGNIGIGMPSVDSMSLFFAVGFAAAGAVVYFILKQSGGLTSLTTRYPVKVPIYERRGQAVVKAAQDSAVYIPSKGTYNLKSRKADINAQDYKYMLPGNEVMVYSPERGTYWPMDIMLDPFCAVCGRKAIENEFEEKGKDGVVLKKKRWECPGCDSTRMKIYMVPIPNDQMKFVFANAMEKTYRQYAELSPMEKYLPLLSAIVVALIIGGLFYLAATQSNAMLATSAGALQGISNSIAQSTGNLAYIANLTYSHP